MGHCILSTYPLLNTLPHWRSKSVVVLKGTPAWLRTSEQCYTIYITYPASNITFTILSRCVYVCVYRYHKRLHQGLATVQRKVKVGSFVENYCILKSNSSHTRSIIILIVFILLMIFSANWHLHVVTSSPSFCNLNVLKAVKSMFVVEFLSAFCSKFN